MPNPSVPPADTAGDGWHQRLAEVRAYVTEHGCLPSTSSPDPHARELIGWWMSQLMQRDRMSPESRAALDDTRDTIRQREHASWSDQLAATRTYVHAHEGRFPTTRDPDRKVAALGAWYVSQRMTLNRPRMTPEQLTAVEELRAEAADLRAAADEGRKAVNACQVSGRAREIAAEAGLRAAAAAREALAGNPHLLPGDAELLQLRVDHPTATIAELAAMAGVSAGQFASKFRGALRRGPNSDSPQPKTAEQRPYEPGEAGRMLGVPAKVVGRWEKAGLITAEHTGRGGRRYRGAELLRVKDLLAGGWPAEFQEAAKDRRARRRAVVNP